jgi:hypothetical protein
MTPLGDFVLWNIVEDDMMILKVTYYSDLEAVFIP